MSVEQISIMLGIFFVITIIISFVKKVNPGIVGLCFAIIAAVATNTKFSVLQSGFPVNVVMTLFSISLFFGYFIDNGKVEWIAKKLLYMTQNIPKLLPFIFFVIAMILGGIGGANMVVFSVAIAFPVGVASGMKAWETGAICLIGTQCGSYLPWGTHGSTARAVIETMNDGAWADVAMELNWKWWLTSLIVYIIVIAAFYIIFQNYKLTKSEKAEQPGELNHIQKLSIIQIAIVLLLIICMPLLAKSIDNPLFKSIAGLFAINYGLNPVMALSVVVIGSATTAMSPLSGGGGQIMGACTEDICDNQLMFNKMFLTAFMAMMVLFVEACLGLFGIFNV